MKLRAWTPAVIFGLGSLLLIGIDQQREIPLRGDLSTAVPAVLLGHASTDLQLHPEEARVAGVDDYLLRSYAPVAASAPAATPAAATPAAAAPALAPPTAPAGTDEADAAALGAGFSVYVGYYRSQAQGRTIHSPKNCLPGSGWEALESREERIVVGERSHPVNRYVLQREGERALVLYWYQGRGRVQANEYLVKLDLLRDSALRARSDEALVRIVVPITGSEADAFEMASGVARRLIPAVRSALPT